MRKNLNRKNVVELVEESLLMNIYVIFNFSLMVFRAFLSAVMMIEQWKSIFCIILLNLRQLRAEIRSLELRRENMKDYIRMKEN